MSGHSKWANIKNRKGAQDKKRSEAFTKVSKNIITAIRSGGGNTNPASNAALQTAIEKARVANMPKENIDRLLKTFEERKANLAVYMLEGYGPFGVPLMIEIETDNKNRTQSEIKFFMKEHEGSLGEEGCVGYQFKRVGEIDTEGLTEDQQLEMIDFGAEDVDEDVVIVEPSKLHIMMKKMEEKGIRVVSGELVMRPVSPMVLENEEQMATIADMIDELEERDDVIGVFVGVN